MPQIGNNLIINIKDSCVLSVIGVAELLYKTKAAAGALYMNFETYTITMIMYFIMTFTCSRICGGGRNAWTGAENFDLATTDYSGPHQRHEPLSGSQEEGGCVMKGETILQIRHLSKTFGTNLVLRDIDFQVDSGDVTCIIGALRLRKIHPAPVSEPFGDAHHRVRFSTTGRILWAAR